MKNGLDDFYTLLREVTKISSWVLPAAGVSLVVAALVGLNPPWPNKVGLTVATSAVVLLALIFVFQYSRGRSKKIVNRLMLIFILTTIIFATVYFSAFSILVYTTPVTGESFAKGYSCTPEAIQLFGTKCPWLDLDELRSAEYEATRLWTMPSIAVSRMGLLLLWFSLFSTYSLALASFVCFQSGAKSRFKGSEPQQAAPPNDAPQ
jgi:hypothetical protein